MSEKKTTVLDRIDSILCKMEKNIAGIMFLVMSTVVLADVVHRVFSRTPGRLASILSGPLHTTTEALDPIMDRFVIPVIFFLVACAAVQSRAHALKYSIKPLKLMLHAAAGLALSAGVVIGFIKIIPSGLVWSPYFGLCCLLWLGLLGASIAAHHAQHLALEMGEKLWPARIRPIISKIAGFLTGSFCALVAYLAFLSVKDHYVDWSSGPGAGLIPSIDWPKWMVYMVIPYSFAMMAFRFIGRAFGLLSEADKKDEAEHIQEMINGGETT